MANIFNYYALTSSSGSTTVRSVAGTLFSVFVSPRSGDGTVTLKDGTNVIMVVNLRSTITTSHQLQTAFLTNLTLVWDGLGMGVDVTISSL